MIYLILGVLLYAIMTQHHASVIKRIDNQPKGKS